MIRVGTASWSDPEFVRDWYPAKMPAGERLSWYAGHFNLVEVNSSFYGIPAQTLIQRWCDQTPEGFTFDVKLHKLLSRHAAKMDSLPPVLRKQASAKGENIILTPEIEAAVAKTFREAVEPMVEQGKFGRFLLQLSPAFSPRSHQLEELEQLISIMSPQMAVELRNRNWLVGEQKAETVNFFSKHDVPLVMVDAPADDHFTILPKFEEVTSSPLAYLRLHGRNAKAYLTGKTVATRFDYDYSDEELQEVYLDVERLAGQAKDVHVIFNNNRSNYAPKAAERFKRLVS
jgi:uncharacterized protein YecE (DUF72 family)